MFTPDFSGDKYDIFRSMHNATRDKCAGCYKECKANGLSLKVSLNASESYQS